jgi:hypothetical protein
VNTLYIVVSDGLGAVSNTATVTVNVTDIAAEIITVLRTQLRVARSEWRRDGNSTVPGPGNSIDIYVGSDTAGTLLGVADVDNLGVWTFRERNSATLPDGATTLTAPVFLFEGKGEVILQAQTQSY